MVKKIEILNRPLEGEVRVPSSKSIGHRLLICAALANGESAIDGLTMSKDILATMQALKALGAEINKDNKTDTDRYLIRGIGDKRIGLGNKERSNGYIKRTEEAIRINCSESGSTLRFLIPVGLSVADHLVFSGEGRLVERPIDEYFPIFKTNDIAFDYAGKLPIECRGRLKSGHYDLSGRVSSQYTTGMLLASPMFAGPTEIRIQGEMESKGYIDLSIEAMAKFGASVAREGYEKFVIEQPKGYSPAQVQVEGDYSQGAFWIVAGLLGCQPIRISGLNPNSVQGDAIVLELVRQMGGRLVWQGEVLTVHPSETKGIVLDASQCPDLIPIMCVLATQSEGETRIVNGSRLRVKESDRICSTVTELSKMGGSIVETQDGMIIKGKTSLKGGCEINSWNDHRIVMAASVAATICENPIHIVGYDAVEKSYPNFFKDFIQLGGSVQVL